MKVNFYATLRRITGQKTVEFALAEGATAQDVLDAVLEKFPALQEELVDEDGNLYRYVHLFINGRDVIFLPDEMASIIRPTDKIDLFPAVAGGTLATHERVVRNIPLWLLREYLEEVGGEAENDNRVLGDGWTVDLEQVEDFQIGSIVVGQVRFYAEGDELSLGALMEKMEMKLIRAGG